MPELVLLKLGGSLITDKARPFTPRLDLLDGLAGEIAAARGRDPGLKLVLGHGSGSFGHTPAAKYGTRGGVATPQAWGGFCEVWWQAGELNRHVLRALRSAGLPALSLSPLAAVSARGGRIARWDLGPLQAALDAGTLPVVYGDAVFDEARGGTILSTEDLFAHLARMLRPARILLAGLEPCVWADFPARTRALHELTRASFAQVRDGVGGAAQADVTGGMSAKVGQMLDLVEEVPGLQAWIFSGETRGNVERALRGEPPGTRIAPQGGARRARKL